MLREGRTYEKAAERFRLASQKEPTDFSHPIGLGCALASRAASIAHAAAFTQMRNDERANYPKALKNWEEMRAQLQAEEPKTLSAADFDSMKPKLPPARVYNTKDDQTPFTLTFKEAAVRVNDLSKQARQAWEGSLALAKTPGEKAQALYVQAWGLRVLEHYALPVSGRPEDGALSTPEGRKAAVQSAEQAANLAPDNAVYWQAVGDLISGDGLDDTAPEKAIAAYEKSVLLAPKNANVLYFLYRSRIKTSQSANATEADIEVLLNYLHRAQARDKANAWPRYEEAGLLFRLAPYSLTGPSGNRNATPKEKQATLDVVLNDAARKRGKQAVDIIVAGNALPRYEAPLYEESVPQLLAQAWKYNAFVHQSQQTAMEGSARLRELARSVMGYAEVMVGPEKNTGEALRASRALVGMGKKVIGDAPAKDDPKFGRYIMEPLVGIAITNIGYKTLIETLQKAGNTAAAESAQKESDDFKKSSDKYRADLNSYAFSGSATDDVY